MNNILNPENKFFGAVRKIVYILLLSVLWTLCSLPIITIGPATTALYFAVVKSVRKERSYPVKEFFKAFRYNAKQGILLTMIFSVGGLVSGYSDCLILLPSLKLENAIDFFCVFILLIKILLFLSVFLHVFPLISRFHAGIVKALEVALVLSFTTPLKTALLIMIVAVSVLVCSMELLLLGIIPAVAALSVSYILEPIYQKYYQISDLDGSNGIFDPWYDQERD